MFAPLGEERSTKWQSELREMLFSRLRTLKLQTPPQM